MANPDRAHGFKYEYSLAGPAAIPFKVSIASNQTLAKGDAIARQTNGLIAIATSSSTAIWGVMAHAKTTAATATGTGYAYPALPTTVFSGQCSGDFEQTDIGESVDIEGTTGIMELNENASSTGVARIVAKKSGSAFGTWGEALFVWKASDFSGQA